MLCFKPTFSLSSFTFIKRFFGTSPISAIRVLSSAYLRLLNYPVSLDSSLCFIQPRISHDILGGSKITANGDCSHEIKRCLLLGRKVMTNLDSILKSRDITLSTKVRLVKAMVFPLVMYGCESWTVKKTEHQRIDAFELWC